MRSAQKKPGEATEMSRRTALARLGIGVALAYSAPTIVHLDRGANATLSPTPCGRGKHKLRYCHAGRAVAVAKTGTARVKGER